MKRGTCQNVLDQDQREPDATQSRVSESHILADGEDNELNRNSLVGISLNEQLATESRLKHEVIVANHELSARLQDMECQHRETIEINNELRKRITELELIFSASNINEPLQQSHIQQNKNIINISKLIPDSRGQLNINCSFIDKIKGNLPETVVLRDPMSGGMAVPGPVAGRHEIIMTSSANKVHISTSVHVPVDFQNSHYNNLISKDIFKVRPNDPGMSMINPQVSMVDLTAHSVQHQSNLGYQQNINKPAFVNLRHTNVEPSKITLETKGNIPFVNVPMSTNEMPISGGATLPIIGGQNIRFIQYSPPRPFRVDDEREIDEFFSELNNYIVNTKGNQMSVNKYNEIILENLTNELKVKLGPHAHLLDYQNIRMYIAAINHTSKVKRPQKYLDEFNNLQTTIDQPLVLYAHTIQTLAAKAHPEFEIDSLAMSNLMIQKLMQSNMPGTDLFEIKQLAKLSSFSMGLSNPTWIHFYQACASVDEDRVNIPQLPHTFASVLASKAVPKASPSKPELIKILDNYETNDSHDLPKREYVKYRENYSRPHRSKINFNVPDYSQSYSSHTPKIQFNNENNLNWKLDEIYGQNNTIKFPCKFCGSPNHNLHHCPEKINAINVACQRCYSLQHNYANCPRNQNNLN